MIINDYFNGAYTERIKLKTTFWKKILFICPQMWTTF